MATFKYIVIKGTTAINGKPLATMSQGELKELYEGGDTRFIERVEEIKKSKEKTEIPKDDGC